jgi:ABC-type dipeptide/oligopeptide/nickel transport system permease subunit
MNYQAGVGAEISDITDLDERPASAISPTGRAIRRLLRKKVAVVCLVVIAIFYLGGIFAPWIAPYAYEQQDLDASFQGPSREHILGTDRLGRDLFSRVLFAARTTTVVTLATIAAGSIILPLSLGLLAGYRGGWIDSLIMRSGEILASFPGLPMLVLINATMRPRVEGWVEALEDRVGWDFLTASGFTDYLLIFFVLSLFGWVGGARLIRTQVLTFRRAEFIMAAEASGAGTPRILFRHVLPGVMPIIIVGLSASLGAIALAEVGLTFLGVGVQPPHPSFGALITDGVPRSVFENHPQILLIPAFVVASLVFAFNLLGDALNDVFTPRAR